MPSIDPATPRPAASTMRQSILDSLPAPGADALAQSAQLQSLILVEIDDAGGWISFARFMELALYTPGLGYYSGGAQKFGADGDFITAPEITPLFGQSLARQIAQVMQLSSAQVLEVGAGTGRLAADVLLALQDMGQLPERYAILELSGELRARQAETLAREVPELLPRVCWLDSLPDHFDGCLIANEVLDVMPQHVLCWRDGDIVERGVCRDGDALNWAECPLQGHLRDMAQALPVAPEDEYTSEVCLAARGWIREWAARIGRGAMLLIDYGYPQAEYYLPTRTTGTLQCYYRHRTHNELLRWPGLNDITAFVDFTAAAEAGFDAGLQVLGYTTQASFLNNCGLLELLSRRGPTGNADYIRAARAAQRLIAPHEMGELFKVLALGRGIEVPLIGFLRGDRTHSL